MSNTRSDALPARPIDLLLVVAAYYPDSFGGAERQAKILAEALCRRGVRLRIVAPTLQPDAAAAETTAFGSVERHRVKHLPNYGGRRLGSTLAWTLKFLRRYATRKTNVDVIYVFHARLHILPALIAAWILGVPLLVKLGGGGEASDFLALQNKRYFYGHWVLKALLARTDGFIANSGEIVSDLKALGVPGDKIFAIPNGVEIPARSRLQKANASRNGRRFVFTSRMVADKSIEVLFEAARLARLRGVDFQLLFLGEGEERSRLQEKVDQAGLRDVVAMPGLVDDVYDALFANDFFVSASRREGQSNALLEAMSAGCIPIVYGASGASDVIQHNETGFLLPCSDPATFADAFQRALALSDADRVRMSEAAYASTAATIGVDAIARRSLEATKILIARRAAVGGG